MNVNGSRFHLLLGQDDWNRCLARKEGEMDKPSALAWDTVRNEVHLQNELIKLDATPGEIPFTLNARRSAAADRHGNIYWIDSDRTKLRVRSVGSDRASAFWPDLLDCHVTLPNQGEFEAVEPDTQNAPIFTALTVTEDHYLVAAFTRGSDKADKGNKGLLAFDLMAGGPPAEMRWPASLPFTPFDMAQRQGGGVWVLDRDNARLWELDRRFTVVDRAPSPETSASPENAIFQPVNGAPRVHSATAFPAGIDLTAMAGEPIDPIAIEVLDQENILILDRNPAACHSRIFHLQHPGSLKIVSELDQPAHDFVLAKTYTRTAAASSHQLLVVTASGNQALAFNIETNADTFALHPATELFPLRLFGGRAVLKVKDTAWYDSGLEAFRWVPVVQQPRARYHAAVDHEAAELVTPPFDGLEQQCVWDRLMLDASIPADASIEVFCRVADEAVPCAVSPPEPPAEKMAWCEIIGSWVAQPAPYLRATGAELPWLRAEAVRATHRETGTGTWELLLQNMRGRYLQVKLRFSGNGMVTPRLRALRAWYPRFSYPQRFLPAVYREDPAAGDFLERFLANMEGINTLIEDRIVQIQALFDPRSAPAETLEWLAAWFDVALDPKWEEWRRRLFIRHIMYFFRWRGTAHGLRLALSVAFEDCLTEETFAEPNPDTLHLQSIRIVETYLTRKVGAVAAGDAGRDDTGELRTVKVAGLWSPQEGNEGLLRRYAGFMSKPLTLTEQLGPFELVPPSSSSSDPDLPQRWRQFCEQHLGFVPAVGAADRQNWQHYLAMQMPDDDEQTPSAPVPAYQYPSDWPVDPLHAEKWRAFSVLPNATRLRWQDFLARRYRHITKLNTAYQTAWPAFDLVALPDFLPETQAAQTDWLQFEKHLLAIVRSAHRFSVLLPVTTVTENPVEMERQVQLARRIIELEKPAHTVFDIRFYWALNRIGEARLGLDTLLDIGSRAPQLLPDAVLGQAYLGASFVGDSGLPAGTDQYVLKH